MHLSSIELGLLIVLIVFSLGLFLYRFRTVIINVRKAKSEPGYHLGSLAARAWDFIWEVMLQGKVIRERPLPGLAHAFVFWGFCAFALVTLNHFATGFGFPFLSWESGFGKFYFGLAALFGVAVAVSIAGLFIRRFLVKPKWLGYKVSVESGVIALLIFMLMVTYLGTLRVDEATAGGRALWWSHTLALLIFLPLIPHTKHLHLVLSPITIFLKRQTFSQIPPLEGDEDFGLDTGKDLTKS